MYFKNLLSSQPEDGSIKNPKPVAIIIFYLSFNCIYITKVMLDCIIIYIFFLVIMYVNILSYQ
jgi:hypothetical protein